MEWTLEDRMLLEYLFPMIVDDSPPRPTTPDISEHNNFLYNQELSGVVHKGRDGSIEQKGYGSFQHQG